jgi:uncharacterized membrane protein
LADGTWSAGGGGVRREAPDEASPAPHPLPVQLSRLAWGYRERLSRRKLPSRPRRGFRHVHRSVGRRQREITQISRKPLNRDAKRRALRRPYGRVLADDGNDFRDGRVAAFRPCGE